jgi:hypothetical protein
MSAHELGVTPVFWEADASEADRDVPVDFEPDTDQLIGLCEWI